MSSNGATAVTETGVPRRNEAASAPTVPEGLPEDQLWDAHEVVAFLGVKVSWVREATRQGSLPHARLGRYRRYGPTEIRDWLDKQMVGAA
jgi:predicted DNA-binding transcriptional regulator AlpA